MAIGLGYMFNVQLPVNFNSPYKACSVKELWQRWHMTLSRFFVTYVYIPLGGSKKGKARTILNTMVIFSLSGLWHGANWTYVAWGVMQGLLVVWDNLGIIGVRGSQEKILPVFIFQDGWDGFLPFPFSIYPCFSSAAKVWPMLSKCLKTSFPSEIRDTFTSWL